ncbi:Aluminum-activated malate transporter 2 [Acorus calamus]|uniref:Aluminum-activated malate transporter 2 n=1 Tax=Acorus calamus TaxID=4465 RepID=A0AAV9E9I5_ACOCL|nr:Aluminum-activated malate transporter 2 [Acorus calamus]
MDSLIENSRISCLFNESKSNLARVFEEAKRLAKEDPRRVIHSFKVGVALTLVSLLYYIRPVYYDGFGVSTMWAVLTVILIMEYSVGATIGKGLNRVVATVLGGSLGLGVHHLAKLLGEKGEPIFIAASVFLLDLLGLGHRRLSTVAVGVAACLCVSMFVCPVWAGEDLRHLVALNIELLASSLEGLSTEYFVENDKEGEDVGKDKKNPFKGYQSVLNSKSTQEALANFARWEPGHGQIQFLHPWKHYLKIGNLTCQCACRIQSLHLVLNSGNQPPLEMDTTSRLVLYKLSSESGKALSDLASSIRSMTTPSFDVTVLADKLKSIVFDAMLVPDTLKLATATSLLIEIVTCVERITGSVGELAQKASFEPHKALVDTDPTEAAEVVVLTMD